MAKRKWVWFGEFYTEQEAIEKLKTRPHPRIMSAWEWITQVKYGAVFDHVESLKSLAKTSFMLTLNADDIVAIGEKHILAAREEFGWN